MSEEQTKGRATVPAGVRLGIVDHALLLRSYLRAIRHHRRDAARLARADAAVISFAKSGRTWVRTMLSRVYQRQWGIPDSELLEFDNFHAIHSAAPRILFTHDVDSMVPAARIPANKDRYAGRPVTILARHPADIVVSRHFHLKHRSRDPARKRFARAPFEVFVWSDRGGVPSIVTFLNHWAAAARQHPEFDIQRYEDFLADPHAALARLAAHLGTPADEATIADAVDFASFDNLKKKEAEQFFSSDRLRPQADGNPDSFKVRSGKAGRWVEQCSPEDAERIRAYITAHLDPVYGYGATP
jgi:hypothetical protein